MEGFASMFEDDGIKQPITETYKFEYSGIQI